MGEMTIGEKLCSITDFFFLAMYLNCPDCKHQEENCIPKKSAWVKELNANSLICSLKNEEKYVYFANKGGSFSA